VKNIFYEPRGVFTWFIARFFMHFFVCLSTRLKQCLRLPLLGARRLPLLLMALLSALSFQATAQVTSLTVTIDPPNPSVNQEVFLVVTQTGPQCQFGSTRNPTVTGFSIDYGIVPPPSGIVLPCSSRVSVGTLSASGRYTVFVESVLGGRVTTSFTVSAIGQTQPVPVIGSLSLVLLCLTLGFVAWFTMGRDGLGARNANKSLLPALLAGLFIAGVLFSNEAIAQGKPTDTKPADKKSAANYKQLLLLLDEQKLTPNGLKLDEIIANVANRGNSQLGFEVSALARFAGRSRHRQIK
jgi:hypothetical protein